MGCCFPCFKNSSSQEYQPINRENNAVSNGEKSVEVVFAHGYHNDKPGVANAESPEHVSVNSAFHAVPDTTDAAHFDQKQSVFSGTWVQQKFSNKSLYDPKFAWINIQSRTLNLSDFPAKEKRHKEASLSDVISLIAGPPDKYRGPVGSAPPTPSLCLTVKFVRGGGIDLLFESQQDRETWYEAMSKLLVHQKHIEADARSTRAPQYP